MLFSIPKGSNVIIQYPMVNLSVFYKCLFALKRQNIVALIHDLPSFRYVEDMNKKNIEVEILNSFSGIITHSEAMSDKLKQYGAKTPMIPLRVFDYLLPDNMSIQADKGGIVFAGALQKSVFLKDLHNVPVSNVHFNLYGGVKPDIDFSDSIKYQGAFLPDDISSVKGEWGLLWDGESCEKCSGNFGEYLTLIAPHKFSLYVACGLKIIAWKDSAMAPLIEKGKLGFTISSLYEIEDKIKSLSDEQMTMFESNVKALSSKLRNGYMLENALSKFIS